MKLLIGSATVAAMLLSAPLAPALAQGVDYHKAQQAGKVWQRKRAQINRRATARETGGINQSAAARRGDGDYHAPLTRGERLTALMRHRAGYNRVARSSGTASADRWLEEAVRADRANRR